MIATGGRTEIVESSESKAIKAQLQAERDFVSAILDTAGALVVVLDTKGRILRFNRKCEETTGYRAREVEGQVFWEVFLLDEEVAPVKKVFENLTSGRFPSTNENYWLTKDGAPRLVSWSNTVLLAKDGSVQSVVAIGLDVTESRKAEQARRKAAADLENANEELAATNEELEATNEELAATNEELESTRDILQVTMENTGAHLAYLDKDFNFIMVNRAYEEACGHRREDLLGKNHFDFFPNEENNAIFEHARETGEPVEFKAKPFEYVDQPWRGTTYWDWTLTPVKEASGGDVLGFVFSLLNVTEAVRSQHFEETLTRINELIHSTLDAEEISRRVVVEAAHAMPCETTGVLLRDANEWYVQCTYGFDSGVVETGQRMQSEEVPVAVMAEETREPVIIEDVKKDRRLSRTMGKVFNIASMMNVPLVVRDEFLGVIGFHYHSEAMPFSDAQVNFARKLAATLSLALENARLFGQQRRIAETLQRSMLRPIPHIPRVDVGIGYASAFESALVGGDFYDIFQPDDQTLSVLIGDVSGKGIEAAGLTETIRSSVRSLSYIDPSPAFVFGRLNQLLLNELQDEMFATGTLFVLNTETGEIRIANAGHPRPIVRGERCTYANVINGSLLGVVQETYKESYLHIKEGETILLYTDGILEARRRSGELFGERRLLHAARSCTKRRPQALVNSLLEKATSFAAGRLDDDVALLALRLKKSEQG